MTEIACYCNWSIPGVETLPAHSHRTETVVRRDSDGLEMRVGSWVDQGGYHVLNKTDCVHIWVNWKDVARAIGREMADVR